MQYVRVTSDSDARDTYIVQYSTVLYSTVQYSKTRTEFKCKKCLKAVARSRTLTRLMYIQYSTCLEGTHEANKGLRRLVPGIRGQLLKL